MHIVYTVCGETVKPEFLMSLKSLYLFAISGFVQAQSFYHIHVLSDGTMDTRDMAFLRPLSNFKASVHATFPGATMLFKHCSTERMYLHQHADFAKLDQVTSSSSGQFVKKAWLSRQIYLKLAEAEKGKFEAFIRQCWSSPCLVIQGMQTLLRLFIIRFCHKDPFRRVQ